MKMRETALWHWLEKANKYFTRLHMTRVENMTGDGFPDVEGCYEGKAFMLELKVAEIKRDVIHIDITTDQVLWLKRRWAVGGNAWVLVDYSGERRIVPGCDASKLIKPLSKPIGNIVRTPQGVIFATAR